MHQKTTTPTPTLISKKELAAMYNCSRNTMTRICREAGVHTRRYLRKMEVEKVFELIGEPESFEQ